jgi:hypothetical protein
VTDTVRCVVCEYRWQPDDIEQPGRCPSCDQNASVTERCDSCPVVEVEHYRTQTPTGHLLERVLEHEFDCKHYRIEPGDVSAEVREGLKILEGERSRWERDTHEKRQQEWEEKQRLQEMQRRSWRG